MEKFSKTELKNEKWKDIDGYDGAYQVSDLGRVRSLKFGKLKVMKQGKNWYGYLTVSLSKDSKESRFFVHRLVAQAFIPNDDETKTIINHKDESRDNNRVGNLEWCTQQYNLTYNDIHLRRKNGKRRKIEKLYDPDLSIKQNLTIFRRNGIVCSRRSLYRLRKDLGLINRPRSN